MPCFGCDNPVADHLAMTVLHHSAGVLPLLRELQAQNVNFVVGSLDGSAVKLEFLKKFLSETLFAMSHRTYSMFNIISFSNEITKWCNRSVRFSPDTVTEAAAWIQTLDSDNGADPQSALTAAFQDPACQEVVLITDSLTGHRLQDICDHASHKGDGRPVHILHLSPGHSLEDGSSYLEGSFQMVSLNPAEASCEVQACQTSCSIQHCIAPEKHPCASQLMVHPEAHVPLCGPPVCHNAALADGVFGNVSTETLGLVRGARVLARRGTDGYYYLGHIAHEVEGSGGCFLLEFERCRKVKGKAQLRMQETALYDIVHYEDARRQPLVPGDRVLAPLDVHGQRYGPGRVLQGAERRTFASDMPSSGVLVNFWNGKTRQVPPGLAVRIPLPLSERIILELQMPPSARQKLIESSPGYPCSVPPGYRSSGGCGQPVCAHDAPWTQPCGALSHTPSCQMCSTVWPETATQEDSLPGDHLGGKKLTRKVDEQRSPGKGTLTESSLSKEKKKKKKPRVEPDRERQAKLSYEENYRKSPQNAKGSGSIKARDGVRSKEAMPRAKDGSSPAELAVYVHGSRGQPFVEVPEDRSPLSDTDLSEISSLQAVLKQIDRSLKKDRLLMEAVLPERRPHSAPNSQRCIWKSPKPDELRKKIEAAKTEEWRKQEEQRQLQKERELEIRERLLQQWELEIREQLQKETQRQKPSQRSREPERPDRGPERNFQGIESQRGLTTFRYGKEKETHEQEEELERPRHKVQYLRTLQQKRDEPDTQHSKRREVSVPSKQEMPRSRKQSPQRRFESEPRDLDRQQNQHLSSKQRVPRGSVHFPHETERESIADSGRRWQREGHSPRWRSSMLA